MHILNFQRTNFINNFEKWKKKTWTFTFVTIGLQEMNEERHRKLML